MYFSQFISIAIHIQKPEPLAVESIQTIVPQIIRLENIARQLKVSKLLSHKLLDWKTLQM